MKLSEMSTYYEESGALISTRLKVLREELRQEMDPAAAWHLKRRIEDLRPMLTQCRKLSTLTARYYDREFHRYDEYCV